MDNEARLIEFLESSFLSSLLEKNTVTDISFNGEAIYYEDNLEGRKKSSIDISKEKVGEFLRQIANLSEKQFSYLNPILDVSFAKYRLNATFLSLTRVDNRKTYSFCLRIASDELKLENDREFFGEERSRQILLQALKDKESIVIGGETSSGKTELQKYLLCNLKKDSRVVVIDNVEELELIRHKADIDMTCWLVDPKNEYTSFPFLIKNSLRNNPDYLIVAESRGEKMMDALSVVMSGHPLIMTIHSKSLEAIPYRMGRLGMMKGSKLVFEDLMEDITYHFSYFVQLKKDFRNGKVHRFIDEIGFLNHTSKKMEILYKRKERNL
ncbi:MAG: ATPase, T2SS/T4P/T4SS family [Bacilli bacterium]|nr:ATPase, T2SS/T4P/T4SS family [Bacilli bacterium]